MVHTAQRLSKHELLGLFLLSLHHSIHIPFAGLWEILLQKQNNNFQEVRGGLAFKDLALLLLWHEFDPRPLERPHAFWLPHAKTNFLISKQINKLAAEGLAVQSPPSQEPPLYPLRGPKAFSSSLTLHPQPALSLPELGCLWEPGGGESCGTCGEGSLAPSLSTPWPRLAVRHPGEPAQESSPS